MNKELDNNSNIKFVRWQLITLNHLTYSINIIFVLSMGIIGYLVNFLPSKDFIPTSSNKFLFTLSMSVLILSIAAGLWATLNRLMDFRMTAKIAKGGEKDLDEARDLSKKLGNKTWCLFKLQIVFFIIGFLFSILTIRNLYLDKLF